MGKSQYQELAEKLGIEAEDEELLLASKREREELKGH